ncbi:MAG TPA: 4-hydroxy-3-methylbut-2-enyl diphosphate reductase [Firmicutes bacterium]|nr:4-hydroxy-3-methylbut-2-enyl diphosphate reductase [Bacillota bacterium]
MIDVISDTSEKKEEENYDDRMQILVASRAGFCEGVERALTLVMTAACREDKSPIYTYGPLIHNEQVVKRLESMGVLVANSIDEIPQGSRVVIRSHGIGPSERKLIEDQALEIIDASCMFVIKAQRLISELYRDGYKIIILGVKEHPEIKALRDFVNDEAIIASSLDELPVFDTPPEKLGVICQTTLNTEFFGLAIERLKKQVPNLIVKNTICDATVKRQEAARDIAGRVDAMIVIGGRHSSNTRKLTDICRERGVDTYHIETGDELKKGWFLGRQRIGVTAGASTPDWMIEEVIQAIQKFGFRRGEQTCDLPDESTGKDE